LDHVERFNNERDKAMSISGTPGAVRTIDRDELFKMVRRGDRFRLVMALNEWAFQAKHIPGSEHFNTPEELFASLSPDDEIVVYCTSNDCHASIALYHALVDRGYRNVRRYSGGLTDWESAGLPLEGNWVT
jgi:rhodanese-related sulfurtransferase